MNLYPYIQIARPSHWFKNVFMLPGVLLVWFFKPDLFHAPIVPKLVTALIAACLIASSNYVLNEILDAEKDKHHPVKKSRPIPSGQVSIPLAYAEWILLAVIGLGLAFWVNILLGWTGTLLWIMGTIYNIPPVRLKDVVYADVLCESINNPIRLSMGWYATGYGSMPPLSALLAYWMFGAFLMAMKRLAEYRRIDDPKRAGQYRRSFQKYNDRRLIESIFFYGAFFGMLSGFFMARYKVELILATPVVAYAMAYYMHLGFKKDSPVQYPERLYRAKKMMWLAGAAFVVCTILLFVEIPLFTRMFTPWQLPP